VDGRFIGRMGGSSLTDTALEIPRSSRTPEKAQIPSTYVPFRNAFFLSIAAAWAEVLEAGKIYIGAVESDSPGYPDCRPAFFSAFDQVIRLGTRPDAGIAIRTPLISLSKKDIILKGVELKAPLHLTWSCYGQEERACGLCESCVMRRRGFHAAGLEDPIPYAVPGKDG